MRHFLDAVEPGLVFLGQLYGLVYVAFMLLYQLLLLL